MIIKKNSLINIIESVILMYFFVLIDYASTVCPIFLKILLDPSNYINIRKYT